MLTAVPAPPGTLVALTPTSTVSEWPSDPAVPLTVEGRYVTVLVVTSHVPSSVARALLDTVRFTDADWCITSGFAATLDVVTSVWDDVWSSHSSPMVPTVSAVVVTVVLLYLPPGVFSDVRVSPRERPSPVSADVAFRSTVVR